MKVTSRQKVWIFFLLYVVVFSFVSWWKYDQYLYDALDLGIFNQVFWNTAHGDWFQMTIHPHSYLGDHFGLGILYLLPFYWLWQDPRMLLILQALVLAASIFPVFFLARKYLNARLAVWVAGLWLLNPWLHSINLHEFHVLTLALPLVLWAFYFFEMKQWRWFIVFFGLSLFTREDVSLLWIGYFVVAILNHRGHKGGTEGTEIWAKISVLISLAYFFLARYLVGQFGEGYKFDVYYQWLGDGWGERLVNLILKFDQVLEHLLQIKQLEFVLGLLVVFFFLPMLRPKWLLMTLPLTAQIMLSSDGGSGTVLGRHYALLFLPLLLVASLAGLKFVLRAKDQKLLVITKILREEKILTRMLVSVVALFLVFGLGPARWIWSQDLIRAEQDKRLYDLVLKDIPDDAAVLTSDEFLSHLSGREHVFALRYAYSGYTQFAANVYDLPETDFALYKTSALSQLPDWSRQLGDLRDFNRAAEQFQSKLNEQDLNIMSAVDDLLLFEKDASGKLELFKITNEEFQSDYVARKFDMQKIEVGELDWQYSQRVLPIEINFAAMESWESYPLFVWQWKDGEEERLVYVPLGYGLVSRQEIPLDTTLVQRFNLLVPEFCEELECEMKVQLVGVDAKSYLSDLRGVRREYEAREILSEVETVGLKNEEI